MDRYVEEDESIESQNKSKKNTIDNTFWASVYPNPSNGELVVKTNQENLLSIEITDMMGKLVYQKNNIENNKILHLSKLNSGLYSIKLQDENNKIKLFKWVVLK